MVRPGGLEPPARGLGNRCSIRLSYGRTHTKTKTGAPGRIRTCDLQIRSLSLYPAELRARVFANMSIASRIIQGKRIQGERTQSKTPLPSGRGVLGLFWRRERDSNPR